MVSEKLLITKVEDRLETPLVRDTKGVSHLTSLQDVEGSPPLWSCFLKLSNIRRIVLTRRQQNMKTFV